MALPTLAGALLFLFADLKSLRTQKDTHLKEAMLERQNYYTRKRLCEMYTDCVCFIVDGMDQNKLSVPCLPRYPKALERARCLKLSLQGVKMVCGDTSKFAFLNSNRFQRNANDPMNAIVPCIAKLFARCDAQGVPRPERAYFQFDNCPTQNKSKAMYGLMAALVGLGVFDEVHVNFLIVGHTHEDIDQMFSVVSKHLKKRVLWTPGEMFHCMSELFSPPDGKGDDKVGGKQDVLDAAVFQHEHVDYVSWISQVLPQFTGVTNPHVLRFKRDVDTGDVLLSTKNLSSDKTWEEDGILLTKDALVVLANTTPAAVPLAPLSGKKIMAMLRKCDDDGLLPPGVLEEWDSFFQVESELTAEACSECT